MKKLQNLNTKIQQMKIIRAAMWDHYWTLLDERDRSPTEPIRQEIDAQIVEQSEINKVVDQFIINLSNQRNEINTILRNDKSKYVLPMAPGMFVHRVRDSDEKRDHDLLS